MFTAFQLFRVPEFQTKLRQIPTPNQRTALLGALLAWGLKDFDYTDVNRLVDQQVLSESTGVPSIHFRGLSIKYMEKAVAELGDEPLSLPLLQAMILNTLCLLVQGVRGRAWRMLGTCIRSAYELNLHLIDAGKSRGQDQSNNVAQWCVEEEWRRAWWAIWELDVFASVIRRCPAGIDWSQNDTFLPVEDEKWYRGEPQSSCPLELDVTERWKALIAVKTQSPKAWFIVINSLMKDAQRISSPMNIDTPPASDHSVEALNNKTTPTSQQERNKKTTAAINRLSTVLNSLYCTVMALPQHLKYHGQYLDFGDGEMKHQGGTTQRQARSHVFGIYMMTQLTKMMVFKYHVFRTGTDWTFQKNSDTEGSPEARSTNLTNSPYASAIDTTESLHLAQYFEASENIVHIIRRCSDDYYKHVNPFFASTVWLAGAVQLLQRSRLPDDCSDRNLINSNFALLCLTYQKTVEFWNMSKVPLKDWDTLEDGLENMRSNPNSEQRYYHATPCIFTGGKPGHNLATKRTFPKEIGQNPTSEQSKIDAIFEYLSNENGTRDGPSPSLPQQDASLGTQDQQDFSSLSNIYTPPILLPHAQYQHPYGTTSAEQMIGIDQIHVNGGSEPEVDFTSPFLDNNPFAVERNFNMDFSNYLDEIFSGSYLQ